MTSEELKKLVIKIINSRSEYQNIELKAAKKGCPEKLYDSLSSFSNSDNGGIIIFGIDEENSFSICGVYDLQDIQQKITEQCDCMTPKVRPLFSYTEIDDKLICSAEIPSVDITERPCYYSGKGRIKGSYIRVGTNDKQMTEYEIYSYEAFRKKYQDDIRPVPRVTEKSMNIEKLNEFIALLTQNKPNLAKLDYEQIKELMSITVNGKYSLFSTLLFSLYPQAYFPQLCIIATSYPENEIGITGRFNERFLDNDRIEGTIQEIIPKALNFVIKNTRSKTIIDKYSGERKDVSDYPMVAVREIILNALIHRDYSIHTEGMPIQLQIFPNRMEVSNPGGLYGRISIDRLGNTQPDTRNPVLATALELMKITENRYSGIPTVIREMKENNLPYPKFENNRNSFKVTLWNFKQSSTNNINENDILSFCSISRTRQEIADFLNIKSVPYAIKKFITPLLKNGKIVLTIPEKPKSPEQKFLTNNKDF